MRLFLKHAGLTILLLAVGVVVVGFLFVRSGWYNFAADEPHYPIVVKTIDMMRERSINERIDKIEVPNLADSTMVSKGAGNYAAMCATCHLAPGVKDSEMSLGLYPSPPNLTQEVVAPTHAFWVIKHGVKTTGMPAWGKSMDDKSIWELVAFLQKLPKMDDPQYDALVGKSGGHSHSGGEPHHGGEMGTHDSPMKDGMHDHRNPAEPAGTGGH